jgi:hypothetical protein
MKDFEYGGKYLFKDYLVSYSELRIRWRFLKEVEQGLNKFVKNVSEKLSEVNSGDKPLFERPHDFDNFIKALSGSRE